MEKPEVLPRGRGEGESDAQRASPDGKVSKLNALERVCEEGEQTQGTVLVCGLCRAAQGGGLGLFQGRAVA